MQQRSLVYHLLFLEHKRFKLAATELHPATELSSSSHPEKKESEKKKSLFGTITIKSFLASALDNSRSLEIFSLKFAKSTFNTNQLPSGLNHAKIKTNQAVKRQKTRSKLARDAIGKGWDDCRRSEFASHLWLLNNTTSKSALVCKTLSQSLRCGSLIMPSSDERLNKKQHFDARNCFDTSIRAEPQPLLP